MADAIIDSDVLIDALRGVGRTPERLAAFALTNDLFTTAINVFEIGRGLTPAGSEAGTALLREFEVLPLDDLAATRAAAVYQELRAAGTLIDTGDLLIAGIALARGMAVITRNRRDFVRVPNLELADLSAG